MDLLFKGRYLDLKTSISIVNNLKLIYFKLIQDIVVNKGYDQASSSRILDDWSKANIYVHTPGLKKQLFLRYHVRGRPVYDGLKKRTAASSLRVACNSLFTKDLWTMEQKLCVLFQTEPMVILNEIVTFLRVTLSVFENAELLLSYTQKSMIKKKVRAYDEN